MQLENQPGNAFSTIIYESFQSRDAYEAGWCVKRTKEWIMVSNTNSLAPSQGWKLHISAGLSSAETILRHVTSVLYTEGASFKVASSTRKLRYLNYGFGGVSQIGKFITIYPTSDAQAVHLASLLDDATRGLSGPRIPSDHPLASDGIVFYRYGGFVSELAYVNEDTTVGYAIRSPDGLLVVDKRHKSYKKPDWVNDPFIAAGIANDSLKVLPPQVIAGRYRVMFQLHESASGGTYLAVDTLQPRSCVIKCAERHAYLSVDGTDACDTLRHEARMLELLGSDPRFPAFFELLEQEGDLYLVMEEIEGITLDTYASRALLQGSLDLEQVVSWARELASMLAKIHSMGLIYHDLKPANVMVGLDRKAHLIDFGCVLKVGVYNKHSNVGTQGYMSPQHESGEPASVADDIYGFGALLYDVVTRAKPFFAPDTSNLLLRPLALLNPALGSGLIQIITRCLDPVAERRFASMQGLDAALAALAGHAGVTPPALGAEAALPESAEEASLHFRALAMRLGDTLCQMAQPQAEHSGVAWQSFFKFIRGARLRDIWAGSAGAVLALTELVNVCDAPAYRSILAQGAQWLVQGANTTANSAPGLYGGEAGVGVALLRAGQVLKNPLLINGAVERGEWVAAQPHNSPDLMHGAAGRLRFHLLLWDETHAPEQLQAALDAGNWLVSAAEDAGAGALCWTLPTGQTYPGYGHGAAGVGDVLLDLFEVTGDERFLPTILGVDRLLKRMAVPVLHDKSGLNWPIHVSEIDNELPGPFWCHGAAGIGKFYLHAHELGLLSNAAEVAARAARAVARTSRWASPIQCHGLSGNIEFLLDMFQSTGDQIYYREARSLASLLETFATEDEGLLVWPSETRSRFTPDYMVGYAGVLPCFLRLADPTCLPHQLSRKGFCHKPERQKVSVID